MGLEVNATYNSFSTLPRLEENEDWAEMKNIPILSNKITVKHHGQLKTIVANVSGKSVNWSAQLPGVHDFLYVNGAKTSCSSKDNNGRPYSYSLITLNENDEVTVSINP
jgi:hypothetical protein